MNRAVSE